MTKDERKIEALKHRITDSRTGEPAHIQRFIVSPKLDRKTGNLELTTSIEIDGIVRELSKDISHLKDELVYKSLVALGWTPPAR